MDHPEFDNKSLRRYLLGDLDEEERIEIEARLLLDKDYNDQLRIVEDELIDDYLDGALSPSERDRLEQLMGRTPDLLTKVRIREAIERVIAKPQSDARPATAPDSTRSFFDLTSFLHKLRWRPILGLTTLVIALVLGTYWYLEARSEFRTGRTGMLALNDAYRQGRPMEPRISGLNHAPYSVKRGAETSITGQAKLALDRAARIFLDWATEKPGPPSYQAVGRYYLTQKNYVQAIDQFNSALKADAGKPRLDHKQKAQLQNDYAVALMEKAKGEKEKDPVSYEFEMAESRDRLLEAFKLQDDSPEAKFNLGLWLQERRLWKQAEEAWNKYLEMDASSAWADEARKYREIAIEEAKKQVSLTPAEILRDFLDAYHTNDRDKARRILSQNCEPITGRMVWWQLTGAFLTASSAGQQDQANDVLGALAYAGDLGLEKGDHFASELARFYRSSSPQQREALVQARELTQQGHAFCLISKYESAIKYYVKAEELFELSRDSMESSLAKLMTGYCYLQMANPEESISKLQQLARTCEISKYKSILTQVLITLGSAYFAQTEYSKSNTITKQAFEVAQQIEETYGTQKSLAQLANQYKYLDDFHQSIAYLNQCLKSANVSWPGDRQMWRTYDTLAQVLNGLQFYSAAADYQRETLNLGMKDFKDPAHVSVSYVQLASIYSKLQNYSEAIDVSRQGLESSKASSPWMIAYAQLNLGHIYRQSGDLVQALYNYDLSAERFVELKAQVMIYNAYKGRLLCYISQGNKIAANEEIQKVLALAEGYRTKINEEKHRNTFFDAEQSVYDIAIDYEYSQGNPRAAFEYSEDSRARSLLDLINAKVQVSNGAPSVMTLSSGAKPLKLNEIQKQLPEKAQIIQYAMLEDKLLIWAITRERFDLVEKKISLSELKEKIDAYLETLASPSGDRESATEAARQSRALYELLIAPLEARKLLDREKIICIVPDKALNHLPFNALISTKTDQYIINQYTLSFAPSSNVYLQCSEWARQRSGKTDELFLGVGNPSFDHQAFPLEGLPASEREVTEIASFYPHSTVLIGRDAREESVQTLLGKVDVLHLASHYVVDEQSPLQSKLLMAQEPTGLKRRQAPDGVLQAEEIYGKRPLSARLVVLSACRSGVERYYRGEGMIGMSRAFLAAGVPLVSASLWPVDSEAASRLMIRFHKHRKSDGLSTAAALRSAQLEMSNDRSPQFRHPSYWASFILIGGYADF